MMNKAAKKRLTFGLEANEVPEVIMRRLPLRNLVVRLGLDSVDDVGEFDRVLDEEDGNVIANEVPDTLIGVELHRKPTNIAYSVLENQ